MSWFKPLNLIYHEIYTGFSVSQGQEEEEVCEIVISVIGEAFKEGSRMEKLYQFLALIAE